MTILSLLLSVVTAASAQAPAAGLTRIGAAAAVKGSVMAKAPGAAVGRVLSSGKPVYLNDHVTTDAAGRLQVMLLDETVFTIGPNSDMVLDEFVYDPATDSGKVTARVTKGVFRFVTGKVARKDPSKMKINLPVGTIGIRGTIGAAEVSQGRSDVVLLGPGVQNNANLPPGSLAVGNAGAAVVINTPGYGTTVLPGLAPGAVVNMSQLAQNILGRLGEPPRQGGAGGSGGAGGTGAGQSASQSAGQDTASGGALANTSADILSYSNTANTTQQVASQTESQTGGAITNGISSWDQMRNVGGSATYYDGTGSYTCSGGVCGGGGSGSISVMLQIDFAGRTFGGGGLGYSDIALYGGSLSDVTTIAQTSFASLTGNAKVSLQYPTIDNSAFSNTALSFQNRDGVAAKDIVVDLNYNGAGSVTATGSATATRP